MALNSQVNNVITRLVKSDVYNPQLSGVRVMTAHNSIYVGGNFDNLFYYDESKAMEPFGVYNMFIIKYDNNLVFQNRVYINAYCYDLTYDENNILVSGYFQDSCRIGDTVIYSNTSHNDLTVFYASLSSDLESVNWINQILFKKDGGLIYFRTCQLNHDDDNNIYVGGSFEDSLQIGDTVIFSERYQGISIIESYFIAKYSKNNDFIWAKVIFDKSVTFALDANKNIFVLSTSSYANPVTLTKLDPNGNQLFSKIIAEEHNFTFSKIVCDFENNVYISLGINKDVKVDTVDFKRIGSRDNAIIKYSPDGKLEWLKQLGTSGSDFFPGIIKIDAYNNIVSINDYYGNLSVDGKVFESTNRAFFILKMNSDGEFDWFEKSENQNGHDYATSLSVYDENICYIFRPDNVTRFLTSQVSPIFDSEYYIGRMNGKNKNDVPSDISDPASSGTNSQIKVFPNPTSSSCKIIFTLEEASDVNILILNSLGQIVKTVYKGTLSPNTYEFESEISELVGGLYYISFYNKRSSYIQKLVVLD